MKNSSEIKNYKIIITSLILLIIFIFAFYLNWIVWILNFCLSLWIYAILFYLLSIFWRKLRKKEIKNFYIFLQDFLFAISVFFVVSWSIIFGTAYYFNEISPAPMEEYTISNWEKTVKFQTMIHIGKKSFYEKIKENIKNFKQNDWVYFYEWVKPWSKESAEKFNKALWIKFDKDLYINFSKLYWVDFQDNSEFLGLVNDKDYNVDISLDEIVKIYEEKNALKKQEKKSPLDANKEILKTLSKLNDRELKILNYINQALLNAMIWNENILKWLENFQNKELFDVILNERNKVLTDEIINSSYKKIFVTYWKLHFKWVFELLKQNDKNWKIIEVKKFYPIR